MSENKSPTWIRAFDVIFGLISVIMSVIVLVYQELAILSLIFILSIILIVLGLARIFSGIFATYLSDAMRGLNFGIGLVALILGAVSLVFTDFTTQVLIYIIAFALLLNGVARLVMGGFTKVLPKWVRVLFIGVGLLTVALSAVVFLYVETGFLTLVLLLSISFMSNGIARIIQGITGTKQEEF